MAAKPGTMMPPLRPIEVLDPVLTPRDVLIVADDVTGAAEAAAAMTSWSPTSCELRLGPVEATGHDTTALVIDTDSRYLAIEQARERLRQALAARPSAALVLKKADSLLRGEIADEIAELRRAGRQVIASFALPSLGRTVVGGVVRLHGVPLHETDAWALERARPPHSVTAVVNDPPGRIVPLALVRSGHLAEELNVILANGITPICDAEDQTDLDRIVAAALTLRPRHRLALVGTGALARALGRRLRPTAADVTPAPELGRAGVLVVVGTGSPGAAEQVRRLTAAGARWVELRPEDLAGPAALRETTTRVWRALGGDVAVVSLSRRAAWGRTSVADLAAALPQAVGRDGAHLVLTGGETARRVLDALRIRTLRPITELAEGTVLSLAPGGTAVVTRPGSFGSADSLVDIVAALREGMREGE